MAEVEISKIIVSRMYSRDSRCCLGQPTYFGTQVLGNGVVALAVDDPVRPEDPDGRGNDGALGGPVLVPFWGSGKTKKKGRACQKRNAPKVNMMVDVDLGWLTSR